MHFEDLKLDQTSEEEEVDDLPHLRQVNKRGVQGRLSKVSPCQQKRPDLESWFQN